jgi:hypothetical protein
MKVSELFEGSKVHQINVGAFKPRGAPEVKARAFDKAGSDRSVIPKIKSKIEYVSIAHNDEGEYVMSLVMSDDKLDDKHYNGINVLFFRDGRIEGTTSDRVSASQWRKDKDKIIKVAKSDLKKKELGL